METKEINLKYKIHPTVDGLNERDKTLIQKAQEATKQAYAPYSKFNVGAAILLESGEIITGSNQENVASPTTSCAERTAIFYTGANFPDEIISAIAISSQTKKTKSDYSLSPCGNCRQAIFEYEKKQKSPIRILIAQPDGKIWEFDSITQLLPFSFWVDLA